MVNGETYYYSFETGRRYMEAFPTSIEEAYPDEFEGMNVMKIRIVNENDSDYPDALERYLFIQKGVRLYDETPEWAVD